MKLTIDGHTYEVEVEDGAVILNGTRYTVVLKGSGSTRTALVNGRSMRVEIGEGDGSRPVNVDGRVYDVAATRGGSGTRTSASTQPTAASSPPTAAPKRTSSANAVKASMAGRVLRNAVTPGDAIESGALILILEAMKMENEIRSPRAGIVKSVTVAEGDRVGNGDPLVELE